MAEEPGLITLFVRPLNALAIPYLVTGGVASIVYGEARLTRDIDLILAIKPADAGRFAGAWPAEEFYAPPLETIVEESGRSRYGHFNVVHAATGLRADCYIAGDDPLHTWAFARVHVEWVGPDVVHLAPIEYVILRKLSYVQQGGSDRHLRDVAAMLRTRGDLIDQRALEAWISELDLARQWALAQQFPPER